MNTTQYVYWQDGEFWLGHFTQFPDYITQGTSLEELQECLRDLYKDLTDGSVPGVRQVGELTLK